MAANDGADDAGADAGAAHARATQTRPASMVTAPREVLLPLQVMETNPAIRVDKWLWAVRIFRTRTAATSACTGGKVTVNGAPAKPARPVRIGDLITANNGTLTRTVKVIGLLERRVGAPVVAKYLEDLTPASEYEAARARAKDTAGRRSPGAGRPTKRDRRILQSFFGHGD